MYSLLQNDGTVVVLGYIRNNISLTKKITEPTSGFPLGLRYTPS